MNLIDSNETRARRNSIIGDMIVERCEYFSKRKQELVKAYKLRRKQLQAGLRTLRSEDGIFLKILR